MIIVDAKEAASDLGVYLQKIEQGDTILIVVNNRPIAELRRVATAAAKPRPFGLCAGEFVVPDDFDSPLPEAILADFESP
jgi:antitoxin (DNA-binding transcriptional repressor) of toxin-antitoxin stability system